MFINGRFYSRSVLFAPNDGGESTGSGGAGNSDKTPEGKDSDPDNGGKDKGGNETVPYGRFKEVNDENKSLKAKLAEFESEKAKAEAEKKKQEEAEALKKGEHEKIIAEKQSALDAYAAKEADWGKRTASIQAMVDGKLEEIKAGHGDDILAKVKATIGSDDPWVILEKLDNVLGLLGAWASRPQGWQQHPAGNGKSKLEILKEKVEKKERLTPEEERAYFEELAKLS